MGYHIYILLSSLRPTVPVTLQFRIHASTAYPTVSVLVTGSHIYAHMYINRVFLSGVEGSDCLIRLETVLIVNGVK